MRQDIREGVVWYIMHDIEPNFSAMGRQFNCDYRTAKAAYLEALHQPMKGLVQPKVTRPSLLDPFKDEIDEKLALQCSAKSIYKFLKKKDYEGSYSTVKQYCQKLKKEKIQKATIRVEQTPEEAIRWASDIGPSTLEVVTFIWLIIRLKNKR